LGAALGLINGVLISKLRIPAFIVTLAGLSAFKGIALTVGGGTPIFLSHQTSVEFSMAKYLESRYRSST